MRKQYNFKHIIGSIIKTSKDGDCVEIGNSPKGGKFAKFRIMSSNGKIVAVTLFGEGLINKWKPFIEKDNLVKLEANLRIVKKGEITYNNVSIDERSETSSIKIFVDAITLTGLVKNIVKKELNSVDTENDKDEFIPGFLDDEPEDDEEDLGGAF